MMFDKMKFILQGFGNFLLTLYQRRFLIFEMAKREIATNHVGSMLGFFWTFINPVVTLFIMWLVFSVGFKTAPKGDFPFIIWLTAAMAIWNTFSEVINGSTGVIVGNAHLVKKVVFPLSILPVVKLVASFITHIAFICVLLVLILLYKLPFSIFWFQAFYYFAAMCVLALGLSWLTSAINTFARDTSQIVNVILQIGFWATPVFWDISIMPKTVQTVLKLNPMFYIVQGYRESFLYFVPFWHHPAMTLYFWCVAFIVFALGATVFLKLRPHFADVL